MKKTRSRMKRMKEVDIEFNVSGRFTQTIQILTKDTPKQFIKKLNNGTYVTTLMSDICRGAYVIEFTGNGYINNVGRIVYIDANDAEYDDFEPAQDDVVADTENDIYSG